MILIKKNYDQKYFDDDQKYFEHDQNFFLIKNIFFDQKIFVI